MHPSAETWKEQGCAWMTASTLLWDRCPLEENNFEFFLLWDYSTELPKSLCASTLKYMLPKRRFFSVKDDIKTKLKSLSFNTPRDN